MCFLYGICKNHCRANSYKPFLLLATSLAFFDIATEKSLNTQYSISSLVLSIHILLRWPVICEELR